MFRWRGLNSTLRQVAPRTAEYRGESTSGDDQRGTVAHPRHTPAFGQKRTLVRSMTAGGNCPALTSVNLKHARAGKRGRRIRSLDNRSCLVNFVTLKFRKFPVGFCDNAVPVPHSI